MDIHSGRFTITALTFMAISGCATSPGGYWPYYGNMGYQSGYGYPRQGQYGNFRNGNNPGFQQPYGGRDNDDWNRGGYGRGGYGGYRQHRDND